MLCKKCCVFIGTPGTFVKVFHASVCLLLWNNDGTSVYAMSVVFPFRLAPFWVPFSFHNGSIRTRGNHELGWSCMCHRSEYIGCPKKSVQDCSKITRILFSLTSLVLPSLICWYFNLNFSILQYKIGRELRKLWLSEVRIREKVKTRRPPFASK